MGDYVLASPASPSCCGGGGRGIFIPPSYKPGTQWFSPLSSSEAKDHGGLELWLRWDWTQNSIVGGAEGTEAQSSNWMRLKGQTYCGAFERGVAVRGQRKGWNSQSPTREKPGTRVEGRGLEGEAFQG